eukprot:CAMPEP_0118650910 /NCGR_PEP_ID=MMETSP0785-20121206/10497_1 /TAXON_ID=91992 /ORGANISM="Bolidomonas pacifica, Strain CCMP 1866" /LENGTH=473 /DNA_ID=CAMNT_0006543313 /DNA_START=23 /DNA_END=1440 /DNA_ORIENTATION=-
MMPSPSSTPMSLDNEPNPIIGVEETREDKPGNDTSKSTNMHTTMGSPNTDLSTTNSPTTPSMKASSTTASTTNTTMNKIMSREDARFKITNHKWAWSADVIKNRLIPNLFKHLEALESTSPSPTPPTPFTTLIHTCRTPPKKGFSIITLTSPTLKSRLKNLLTKHYPHNPAPPYGVASLSADVLVSASYTPSPSKLSVLSGDKNKGIRFNWMEGEDRKGNKRVRDNGEGEGRDDGRGGKKIKGTGEEGEAMTDDEVRDQLTPLWREYLVKVDPKASFRASNKQQTYWLYKKTISAKKDVLVKTVKSVRGSYQDKLETRNKEIKKAKQRDMGKYERMDEDEHTKAFGPPVVYPPWTEKNANAVKWCGEGKGIVTAGEDIGYRNKCEITLKKDRKTGCIKAGFLPGGWRGEAADPYSCYNVPLIVCDVARSAEGLLKASAYEPVTFKGVWRMITVRVGREVDGIKGVQVVMQHAG